MEFQELQTVFYVASFLLSYPDQKWREELAEYRNVMEDIKEFSLREPLELFFEIAVNADDEKWIYDYISLFDFGKKTNLYLTYAKNGEQRQRGIELLALKNVYQKAGFQMTDRELPDYLPLFLEFLSAAEPVPAAFLVKQYFSAIESLFNRLKEEQSAYSLILNSVHKACVLLLQEKMAFSGGV
jgi:nitrate reductase delta subunit